MVSAPPSHTALSREKATRAGWVVEVFPDLGGHKTPAPCYLSGKWRYTKTLKDFIVYETPCRVVWKPRHGFYVFYIIQCQAHMVD